MVLSSLSPLVTDKGDTRGGASCSRDDDPRAVKVDRSVLSDKPRSLFRSSSTHFLPGRGPVFANADFFCGRSDGSESCRRFGHARSLASTGKNSSQPPRSPQRSSSDISSSISRFRELGSSCGSGTSAAFELDSPSSSDDSSLTDEPPIAARRFSAAAARSSVALLLCQTSTRDKSSHLGFCSVLISIRSKKFKLTLCPSNYLVPTKDSLLPILLPLLSLPSSCLYQH